MSINLSKGAQAFSGDNRVAVRPYGPGPIAPKVYPSSSAEPASSASGKVTRTIGFSLMSIGVIFLFAGVLHIILRSKWKPVTGKVVKVQEEDGTFYMDVNYVYMGVSNMAYIQRKQRMEEGDEVPLSVNRDYPAKYKPIHVSRHVIGWMLTSIGILFALAAGSLILVATYNGKSSVK